MILFYICDIRECVCITDKIDHRKNHRNKHLNITAQTQHERIVRKQKGKSGSRVWHTGTLSPFLTVCVCVFLCVCG